MDPSGGGQERSFAERESVLVIGAGMAGIACAAALRDAGRRVVVIDKARGSGGRASTRRAPEGTYDHGAQYVTARDPAFAEAMRRWVAAGAAARWCGRVGTLARGRVEEAADTTERFVGRPRMSALVGRLAEGHDVRFSLRATKLVASRNGWRVACEEGIVEEIFDAVVVATPAPQAVPLLAAAPELARHAASIGVDPCWAAMLHFDAPLPLALDGAFVHDSSLAWVARDAGRPGRPPGERIVLHATPAWSAENVELPRERVAGELLGAFGEACGFRVPEPARSDAHRWLYARTREPLGATHLLDPERRIGACGDWCLGARVEDAWRSGRALADALRSS